MGEPGRDGTIDEGGGAAVIERLLASGRAREAVDLAERRLAGGESDLRTELALAEALHLTGAAERAEEIARRLAGESESDRRPLATALLVLVLVRRGDARSLHEARATLDGLAPDVFDGLDEIATRVHHAAGVLALREGELSGARLSLLRALAAARLQEDGWRAPAILDSLGMVHARLGDGRRAERYYHESLAAKRASGDVVGQSITHGNLGRLLLQEGEAAHALEAFDAGLELTHRAGDRYGEVVAMNGRGMALLELGRLDAAERTLADALALSEERGIARQAALCRKDLALVAERRGRMDEALQLIADAAKSFGEQGNVEGVGFCNTVWGRLLFRANRSADAREKWELAVNLLRATSRHDLLADALIRLTEASLEERSVQAAELLDETESLARTHLLRGVLGEVRRLRSRLSSGSASSTIALRMGIGFGRQTRDFLLIKRLQSGGQGDAWRALDEASGQLVVVKRVPLPEDTAKQEAVTRSATAEFEAAMRVDHPAVVRILAFERLPDGFHLAMELHPGGDLRSRLQDRRVDPETAWRWIAEIGRGLDALHEAGVVHRDLKPANVVFTRDDHPVLIDFGLALLGEHALVQHGPIVGTLYYIAPEPFRRLPVGPASDLFSLGVLSAEMLLGGNFLATAPESDTVDGYIAMLALPDVLARVVRRIAWPPHVTEPERRAIERLLQPEPADRFESAAAFLAAVSR